MLRTLLSYIREYALLRPGDRLGVAVSGGADSVALLRGLIETRAELGVVVSVVHVHHGIRGTHADEDEQFVATLARQHGLDYRLKRLDVPAYAREHRLGLEAAGREVRYHYFSELIETCTLDKVATAHTFDDQAETVLLRLIRGTGLQGISGIHRHIPHRSNRSRGIVRPLLSTSRSDVIAYLQTLNQDWREDASNADIKLSRNRIRHELLPLLERGYNPSIRQALVNFAEIARADNEFLESESSLVSPSILNSVEKLLNIGALLKLPTAIQRQVLISSALEFTGLRLGFREIEELRSLAAGTIKAVELEDGYRVQRRKKPDGSHLHFIAGSDADHSAATYQYTITIPGEVSVPEIGTTLRTTFVILADDKGRYNPAALLDCSRLHLRLTLRNWQPGDRFHPLHSKSSEKLKRLFQEKKVSQPDRSSWPVLLSGTDIVWVRGFPVSAEYSIRPDTKTAVLVEEIR